MSQHPSLTRERIAERIAQTRASHAHGPLASRRRSRPVGILGGAGTCVIPTRLQHGPEIFFDRFTAYCAVKQAKSPSSSSCC